MAAPADRHALPELDDFVAGRRQAPGERLDGCICDPNTGAELQSQWQSRDDVMTEAIAHADDLHRRGAWRSRSPEERAEKLEAWADVLEARHEQLARLDARTTGVVIGLTRRLNRVTALAVRLAAKQLRAGVLQARFEGPHGPVKLVRKPLGPAGVISPWNAPTPITAHKVASALAAGCPVVIKPSEWSPHSTDVLAEAALEAGLSPGLVQVVHGAAHAGGMLVKARALCAISFTGGPVAGRRVAEECARQLKPAQLELGGNNNLIVLDDADVEQAAEGIVSGLTTLNAQWCRAVGRVLVHASLQDALLERTLARLAEVRLGSSLDEASEMGPLVHAGHLGLLEQQIAALQAAGGRVHRATPLPDLPGNFLAPTLITGVASERALDEMFGPVATVHAFTEDDEAVALANAVPYGLAGYVFGGDEARAWALSERLETGGVKINGVGLMALSPDAPRPAWKQSGLGHEGARETIEFFCGDTVVGVAAR